MGYGKDLCRKWSSQKNNKFFILEFDTLLTNLWHPGRDTNTYYNRRLIGLTKNIGFQYAKLGIRCNAIAPGAVNTNIGTTITSPNQF